MTDLKTLNDVEGAQAEMPEYVWQFKGEEPGPTVTVMGGLHGNETVGIDVVEQLLAMVREKIKCGTVNIIIGNPEACEAGKRFIDKDANRLWGTKLMNIPEQKRVEDVKPFVASSDLMLDLHSTIKPVDEPFLVVPSFDHELIDTIPTLGIRKIITGEGLKLPDNDPIESDLFTVANGGLGVTIEAGWQEDNNLVDKTMGSVLRALEKVGIFEKDSLGKHHQAEEVKTFEIWNAYGAIFPKGNFQFALKPDGTEWQNYDPIKAGEIIGYENGEEVVAEKDSRLLFPKSNSQIVTGERACILLDMEAKYVDSDYFKSQNHGK
jgi:succinylglutamate desuccinylase